MGARQLWSDEDLLESLKALARAYGEPITAQLLTRAKTDPKEGQERLATELPAPRTYTLRFGSWSKAVALAGLRGGTPRRSYASKWSTEQVVLAVRDFIDHCDEQDERPTARRYEIWRDGNHAIPSRAHVSARMESWSNALAKADALPKKRNGGKKKAA